ncbi:four helix bundle protein [Flavobacterium sp. CG_9.10]|uniref:four helix bundle protein n=1 Tax=Flavobacterium sp. CG_9.10 TaxID=2787729 RepID=UPI0018C91302|nr:four helix bundle protein [Flavobacterium sp. CG_9.10]MBG6110623.1 four helix bundle protein [Flavobacterium sp. CG_9.10]
MKNDNVLHLKSKKFAIRIINTFKYLQSTKKEFVLSKQILRSGTAIGALIKESEFAQSKKDFLNKLYIALKEANETQYWLELLFETEYITKIEFDSLSNDCVELLKLLISITKKLKENLSK